MNRLSIFCIYDSEGIIDRYIGHILKELNENSDELHVVCNMEAIQKGMEYIELYADKIYFRENNGLDVGAFKDVITDFIGWKKIYEFDEVVLMNDSLYGPFIPMKTIFDDMRQKDVDFWGLLKCATFEDRGICYPEHIHSFFLAFRKKLIVSVDFKDYWEDIPYYNDYLEAVNKYETRLTQYFASKGYTFEVYSDSEFNYTDDKQDNYPQCSWIPHELVTKRGFPFLKRHVFRMQPIEHLRKGSLGQLRSTINYIDECTNYDVDMIIENLIRYFSARSLIELLNLIYIFREEKEYSTDEALLTVSAGLSNTFIKGLSVTDKYNHVTIINDFNDLRKEKLSDFEYIGFIGYFNLKKTNDNIQRRIVKAELYRLNENMSSSPGVYFEKNKHLGMLMIPEGHYDIKGYAICPQLNGFWLRKELLHVLWENAFNNMDDFMECIRNEGYFSAIFENISYVPTEICEERVRDKDNVLRIVDDLSFLKNNSEQLYVYGTGNIADTYHELFYGIDAYIVSDGKNKEDNFHGKPVLYLSEVNDSNRIGVYVCLSRNNALQVKPLLEKRNISLIRFYSE